MTLNEKTMATIIERYGSYESYVQQRYHDPKKAEQRKAIASKAGSAKKKSYTFQDKDIASRAGKKSRGITK